MKILMRKGLTSRIVILEDVDQVSILTDYDSPVAVAYHKSNRDNIIAAHIGESDFNEHLNNVGSLAGVRVPLIKPKV